MADNADKALKLIQGLERKLTEANKKIETLKKEIDDLSKDVVQRDKEAWAYVNTVDRKLLKYIGEVDKKFFGAIKSVTSWTESNFSKKGVFG